MKALGGVRETAARKQEVRQGTASLKRRKEKLIDESEVTNRVLGEV